MSPVTARTKTNRTARSSNWRVNSSSVKAVEGAYILRSLKKVAGAVGLPAGYKIRFSTSGAASNFDADTEQIRIGAGDLFKAPMPPENLDILVGRTLHEVYHQTINTAGVWASCLHKVPMAERPIFQTFVSIGEDIVIDEKLTSNENLRDYYEAAMEKALMNRPAPRMNMLLEIWAEFALAKNPDIMMQTPYELSDSIQELAELTEKLRVPMDRFSGTRIRADYYITYWNSVKELILHPPELFDDMMGGSGTSPADESEEGEEENIDGPTMSAPTNQKGEKEKFSTPMDADAAPIDQKLANDIEEAMVSDTEDISQQIYKEFEEAGFKTNGRGFLITRKKETRTIQIKPDAEMCRKLERVLSIRQRLQSRVMRGENYGKLDMRKLHRSQTDQKIFKLKYRFPDGFPETAILVDMSGSMTGDQAEEVIIAATSLASVVKCHVWAYAQNSSEIAITRLNDGTYTHGARPEGNTPSGVALVSVADTLKKGGLIIHLTDGEHNVEFGPAEATTILKKKHIKAVHLLWSEHTGPYAGLDYKVLAGGLGEFPEALYRILIEQLKLEGMARK